MFPQNFLEELAMFRPYDADYDDNFVAPRIRPLNTKSVPAIFAIVLAVIYLAVSCASAHATPTSDFYGDPGLTEKKLMAEPPVPPSEEEWGGEQGTIDPWGEWSPPPKPTATCPQHGGICA